MKNIYIDIMEKSLKAYSDEDIFNYIKEVKQYGLTEHGFPRLTVNIGILIVFGRQERLMSTFVEMMDICCEEIPKVKAANDFSVREICCLLMLLEEKGTIEESLIKKWKKQISNFNPWEKYSVVVTNPEIVVGNWAAFGAVSDYFRGLCCNIDTSEFVDWQLASQVTRFDKNGMYKDPHNPMVYDYVPRLLICLLLCFGYKGKYKAVLEEYLEKSAELTLKMQSVTGEIPYGGRSNQFIHNEAHSACLYEYYAKFFAKKKDFETAGKYKAAAILSQKTILQWLEKEPMTHVKNMYPRDSKIGCEDYGYFNKYMITVASFVYIAYLLADDDIKPCSLDYKNEGYIAKTSKDFHKIFANCAGYFLEFDTKADFSYDANGLGRIHKKNCPSALGLSVPFPAGNVNYKIEKKNIRPMSLCCYVEKGGMIFYGSEDYFRYELVDFVINQENIEFVINCTLSEKMMVAHTFFIDKSGVRISLANAENGGFMVPVFESDGLNETEITVEENRIVVRYSGCECSHSFKGKILELENIYYNRNGRYRVYKIETDSIFIEIKEACEI